MGLPWLCCSLVEVVFCQLASWYDGSIVVFETLLLQESEVHLCGRMLRLWLLYDTYMIYTYLYIQIKYIYIYACCMFADLLYLWIHCWATSRGQPASLVLKQRHVKSRVSKLWRSGLACFSDIFHCADRIAWTLYLWVSCILCPFSKQSSLWG